MDEDLNPTVDIGQNATEWSNKTDAGGQNGTNPFEAYTSTLNPCLINGYDCYEALRRFNPQPLPPKLVVKSTVSDSTGALGAVAGLAISVIVLYSGYRAYLKWKARV